MDAKRAHAGADAAASVRRTRRFQLRVTDAEHAALRAAMAGAGRAELATWARLVLLREARSPRDACTEAATPAHATDSVEVFELRRAVRELVRVGVNLNQCTRALNTPGGDPQGEWARWLERHADTIDAHADAVRNAVEALTNAERA
ncbi:hypothetical protein GSI01S_34_00130 [Gordonia sihwensis NBRC 108236]|uniref:Bacterial mobilisation domain-containing protein n=1 Tax=Gordonia sihwensis NBRC 108236 TaxID=1223544 RepID=L7LNV1_9ACTN|nr:hypothetical protein GSI01S_34_00130 [Gordonia sihwensis NBRC 108236]